MTPEERLARLETHVLYLRDSGDEVKTHLAEMRGDIRELMQRVEHYNGIRQGVWKERALNISGATLIIGVGSWLVRHLW